ncbi:MAG: hypothetical protein HYU03_08340 [Thaumarchaeota archaeon]|nr:hypothetical protein [Nitrososphaerota archaeon]
MSVEDFFGFEKGGIVRSKVSRARVFFCSAKAWASIESELFKAFSTGATLLLNEIGRYYGLGLAREAKRVVPTRSRHWTIFRFSPVPPAGATFQSLVTQKQERKLRSRRGTASSVVTRERTRDPVTSFRGWCEALWMKSTVQHTP